MGFTNYYTYSDGALTHDEWDSLVAFAKLAAQEVHDTTCTATEAFIDITGVPGCENLVIYRENCSLRRAFYGADRDGNVRAFCKTAQLPYDAVVVAVLIASQQVFLIDRWSSDGNTDDTRAGYDLYYKVSDAFYKEHGRNWWVPPPKSHAKAAAAFHSVWKELEPDLMNLAEAAQALASVRGGSTTLVSLLEELNDTLMDKFNLTSRPFNEDPEGVDTRGMLEAWRGELFELVVNQEFC